MLDAHEDQSIWRRWLGLQQKTIEENHRRHCAKELEKLFVARQQIDQAQFGTASLVKLIVSIQSIDSFLFFSSVQRWTTMN